jgi:hypothetical protein
MNTNRCVSFCIRLSVLVGSREPTHLSEMHSIWKCSATYMSVALYGRRLNFGSVQGASCQCAVDTMAPLRNCGRSDARAAGSRWHIHQTRPGYEEQNCCPLANTGKQTNQLAAAQTNSLVPDTCCRQYTTQLDTAQPVTMHA